MRTDPRRRGSASSRGYGPAWPGEPTTLRCGFPLAGPVGVRRQVLPCNSKVLRRVDGQPDPLVPVRVEPPFRRELREGARLVVAALREARERLLAEDVDAAADPVLEPWRLAEARHEVLLELDDAERRAQRDD